MQLATDATDFASGALGMVELALSYLNDRKKQYFSKAEIVEYINQEQLYIGNVINQTFESYFLTSATTSTTTSSIYSLPTDLVKLWNIEVADSASDEEPKGLVEVHLTDREFYENLDAWNDKEDAGFFFIQGANFQLRPRASSTDKTIRVFYVKRLSRLENNADVSEIPLEHHEIVPAGAARRGRIKLGRGNPELNDHYKILHDALVASIRELSPQREERNTPVWGSQRVYPFWPGQTVDV